MFDDPEKLEQIELRVIEQNSSSSAEFKHEQQSYRIDTDNSQTLLEVRQSKALCSGDMIAEKYQVIELIGTGAMGSVYRVEQVFLDQQFALKTLSSASSSNIKLKRFQQEARAAGRLDHPNIVRTIDCGLIDGMQPYLVMDFAEGQTLDKYLEAVGTIHVREAVGMFIYLLEAMEYSHLQGVVHRDIKPSNIVVRKGPHGLIPKIFDFGIAKVAAEGVGSQTLTKTGEIFGTPLYMSPEQCSGRPVDGRSDIYSLGCVLFEALTGTPPFIGGSYVETLVQHLNQRVPTLKEATMGREFSEEIERIVGKMLEKDPSKRYLNAAEAAQELVRVRDGETGHVAGKTSFLSLPFWLQNDGLNLIQFSIYSLVLIALCLFISMFTRSYFGLDGIPSVTSAEKPKDAQAIPVNSPESGANKTADFLEDDMFLSKIVGPPGDRHRFYEFGDRTLGVFGGREKYDPEAPYADLENAIEQLMVADECSRSFQTDDTILQESTMLSHFRPDDLDVLAVHLSGRNKNPALVAIFDAVLAPAGHLSSLRKLDLSGPFSIKALESMNIDKLKKLDTLVLSKTDIDLGKLAKMDFLTQIQMLDISDSSDISPLIRKISKSQKLRILKLKNDKLTDKDVVILRGMTHLDKLDVSDNPAITKDGANQLKAMKNLKQLELKGCSVVSK